MDYNIVMFRVYEYIFYFQPQFLLHSATKTATQLVNNACIRCYPGNISHSVISIVWQFTQALSLLLPVWLFPE